MLAKSLKRWHIGSDRLIVITSKADRDTQELCQRHNVEAFVTDIFYENGAKFNKAAAMAEAVLATGLRDGADWMLTFDADIVPPDDWRLWVNEARPERGRLYGAYRYQQPENVTEPKLDLSARMPQGWVIGFFSLFHAFDPVLPPADEPLFDIHWPHAGNYDTAFTNRWAKDRQTILGVPMIHLGEERSNWTGRGKKKELEAVFKRRKHLEDWTHEKMKRPPVLKKPLRLGDKS